MSANDRQVGGNHYSAEIQHWDLVEDYGLGYLEGCATKYVTRARKKNGLQDIHKAQHYVQKLLEKHREGRRPRGIVPLSVVSRFCATNELQVLESAVIQTLCRWESEAHLVAALEDLRDLEVLVQYGFDRLG